jgi:hypothetical protein
VCIPQVYPWNTTTRRALPTMVRSSQSNVVVERTNQLMRASEALLEAQAQLAHVNRVATMGELTASIAHDVFELIVESLDFGFGSLQRGGLDNLPFPCRLARTNWWVRTTSRISGAPHPASGYVHSTARRRLPITSFRPSS